MIDVPVLYSYTNVSPKTILHCHAQKNIPFTSVFRLQVNNNITLLSMLRDTLFMLRMFDDECDEDTKETWLGPE